MGYRVAEYCIYGFVVVKWNEESTKPIVFNQGHPESQYRKYRRIGMGELKKCYSIENFPAKNLNFPGIFLRKTQCEHSFRYTVLGVRMRICKKKKLTNDRLVIFWVNIEKTTDV